MAFIKTTVVKAPLTSYQDETELISEFHSLAVNSMILINEALINGNLLSYDGDITADDTHYIITIIQNWKDEAAWTEYETNSEMLAERAIVDATFEVTRS